MLYTYKTLVGYYAKQASEMSLLLLPRAFQILVNFFSYKSREILAQWEIKKKS